MATVLVKERLWPKAGYTPHPGQQRVHQSLQRHRVNAAGRRYGKSRVGGMELLPEVYRAYFNRAKLEDLNIRAEYWIVGPNYTDSEKEFRVLYDTCKRLKMPFDRPGTYNDTRSGNMQISLWEGKFLLTAKSGAHPESLVGEGLHGVIMAEAAKMKESVWSKYVRPTLADFQGWSLWNSTPEGKNHFYRMWQQGQDPGMPSWWSQRSPSWVNNFVFRQGVTPEQLRVLKEGGGDIRRALSLGIDPEIADMYVELGDLTFAQEVECSFTEYVGRVYKDWDEETHVKSLTWNPRWPLYVATDYGFTNPNVALFIQVDEWGGVYVIDEYYERNRTEEEFAQDILDHPRMGPLVQHLSRLYPDPEDPGASKVLSEKWKVRKMGGTGGPLKERIRLIRNLLQVQNTHLPFGHPERVPRMVVDRKCTHLIKEMDAYRYPENRSEARDAPENPVKKDDHSPEALSRFVAGHFGRSLVGRARQRQARVS